MTMQFTIGEAEARLAELVAASLRGEDVLLSLDGKPVARIVGLDGALDAVDATHQTNVRRWKAWIGSKAGSLPADAGDLFLEPTYSDEDKRAFGNDPGDPLLS